MSRLSSTNVLIKSQNLYSDEINVSHNNPNKDMLPRVKLNKKLTFKKIEEEIKYLNDYFSINKIYFDEHKINKNLGVSRINTRTTRMKDYEYQLKSKNLTENNRSYMSDSTTSIFIPEKIKFIKNSFQNPSLSIKHLQLKYPEYFKESYKKFYENKFTKNYKSKNLGSILFASRIRKQDDSNKYENVKLNKFVQSSKLKMKWKTINWIINNKKEVLDRLMNFHESVLTKQMKIDPKGLKKLEFDKIVRTNGITHDIDLINKLFWVFDEDGDGYLKLSEITLGLEMFRDSNLEDKIKAFFILCDADNSGTVSKSELNTLMRKCMINKDGRYDLKHAIDKIFTSVELDEKGEITLEKLKEGCVKNREIQDLINKNLMALRTIDSLIDNDIRNELISFNPDLNEQLRMKLLQGRSICIPMIEEKIGKMINNYIETKEKHFELRKLKKLNDDEME